MSMGRVPVSVAMLNQQRVVRLDDAREIVHQSCARAHRESQICFTIEFCICISIYIYIYIHRYKYLFICIYIYMCIHIHILLPFATSSTVQGGGGSFNIGNL